MIQKTIFYTIDWTSTCYCDPKDDYLLNLYNFRDGLSDNW